MVLRRPIETTALTGHMRPSTGPKTPFYLALQVEKNHSGQDAALWVPNTVGFADIS